MSFFSGEGVGIDLGSGNTTVYLENEGIVLREPTGVLVDARDPSAVLAVGNDAYAALGRTGADTQLLFPVMDGAVTDIDMAALLMVALCEKATGRRKPLDKTQLLISMSQGLTKVEQAALLQAARLTGAKKIAAVKTPLAAALGAGLRIDQPRAYMVVVIGSGTCEIAVLSQCGIVAARSMRTGSFSLDEAIVRYMRREKDLIIGLRTAEDLKCDIGRAQPVPEKDPANAEEETSEGNETNAAEASDGAADDETVLIKGRGATSGKPEMVEISPNDIAKALQEPLSVLVDAIADALSRMPEEMASDVLETGIHLSGGGALLEGLKPLIAGKTGLPVTLSEHPHEDVILGLGVLAGDERLLSAALETGAAQD